MLGRSVGQIDLVGHHRTDTLANGPK